ncbi:MAG: hypothetical protein COV99_08170 [Bacteroidetes bacterium CG12_big_fil_rev_8_21_14_0_65_60_17]|nr:MAG: hypothetical protein COV99_08170 [Bacteroidetes bacterium CG12_big_fil_rev_8_21_14_0_65_60_17]
MTRLVLPTLLLALCGTSVAEAQISVRSQLSHDQVAEPGTTYHGTISVRNDSNVMEEIRIYQTDYSFHFDGSNFFGAPGALARSNARWIDLGLSSTSVPPLQTVSIPYAVHVPDSDTLSGSWWSMIMVEGIPVDSPESRTNADSTKAEFGIRQITRYGIQVATHITGTGSSLLNIMESTLVKNEQGHAQLDVSIVNNGNRLAQPDIWIELYDAMGNPVGKRDGFKNRIYPGTSVKQKIVLGSLPQGEYKALVIMDAGMNEVFGAEYTLAIN